MAKHPLCRQRTGPAAEQAEQVQGALLRSPLAAHCSGFVGTVGDEGDHARDDVEPENRYRQPAVKHHRDDEAQEADRKERGQRTAPRRSRRHCPLADEGDGFRLPPPLVVDDAVVGHQLVALRPALPVRKLADVKEDALAAAVGRDEAEALFIFPGSDSSLIAHGGDVGGVGGAGNSRR